MAPRNFSEDGAAGAGNNVGGSDGPFTPESFGAAANAGNPLATGPYGGAGEIGSGFGIGNLPNATYAPHLQESSPSGGASSYYPGLPYGFDDGGSMPDDGGQGGGDDLVSLALATVDSALQYGRQKYGLGQQTAAMMPTIPGTQSESGIPPERPKPRQSDAGGNTQTAAMMPTIPGTQSESGIPPDRPKPRQGAIPDDQDEEAA